MSWKGFTKSMTRAPQTFKSRFNMGEISKDPVFIDAERRFQELETETKKLHEESKKYFDSINGMLKHQIEFASATAELYQPISGRMSDPDSFVSEGNTEGIQACEDYQAVVRDLQTTLAPELEMIETRVVKPADELLEILKIVRKACLKRDHKQLDYDRHRNNLKRLEEKKEKTLKDEKALYKAEADVEQATQDYNYYNDLLKDELPKLFRLEREFIRPLFQSFYYMQLNVFYTLHEKMQAMHIDYFNLTMEIEEGFESKRGDIQQITEGISIVKFKTTGGRPARLRPGQKLLEDRKNQQKLLTGAPAATDEEAEAGSSAAPPPYSPPPSGALSPPTSATGWGAAAAAKAKAKPPPPKPKPSRLSGAPVAETVTALYDYEAQAEGDLSFSAGDVIEIIQRTANTNEWWTGKVSGRQGQFPGNYVQLNS